VDTPAQNTTIVVGGNAVPTLAGTGRSVAEIVTAVHRVPVDEALAALALPGLDRAALEPLLVYCAEQRCVAETAACPGCRRATLMQGLQTFDDFVARHATIESADGRTKLTGAGAAKLVVPSLDELSKTWAGEELWFQARRVLRKLRFGIRNTDGKRPDGSITAPAPAIVLVEPQLADNIGMVARAMANFGLGELRLVAPRDGWPNEKARIAASGATFIIDDAQWYPNFNASLADCSYVVATTARQRDLAKPVLTPEQAVAELRTRIAQGQRCAIIFGRERNGLETHEVANADAIVMAPVDKTFASLNLAQSVLLLAYEWMKQTGQGSLGRVTTYETAIEAGLNNRGFEPANKAELLGLFDHLEGELSASGFFRPPEKRPTVVQNLRSMFTRMAPTQQEVRTLRGVIKALVHGKGPGRRGQ
jgi:tRNA/rRNA methyltransferase